MAIFYKLRYSDRRLQPPLTTVNSPHRVPVMAREPPQISTRPRFTDTEALTLEEEVERRAGGLAFCTHCGLNVAKVVSVCLSVKLPPFSDVNRCKRKRHKIYR